MAKLKTDKQSEGDCGSAGSLQPLPQCVCIPVQSAVYVSLSGAYKMKTVLAQISANHGNWPLHQVYEF